jgi:quinol monooxygenase YgiN
MEPVRLIVRIEAKEGNAEELKVLLRRMIRPTRAERGCRYYELFESNKAGLFYFHELWNSQEELDAHIASKHFTETYPAASALMKEPMEVTVLREIE